MSDKQSMLQQLFEATVSSNPDQIKSAEANLLNFKKSTSIDDFLNSVLNLLCSNLQSSSVTPVTLSISIYLKNLIITSYELVTDVCRQNVKNVIITVILPKLIKLPDTPIYRTLCAIITIVSEVEFPENWPELLHQFILPSISKFQSEMNEENLHTLQCAIDILSSILSKYDISRVDRSEDVLKELKSIISVISSVHFNLYSSLVNVYINQGGQNIINHLLYNLTFIYKFLHGVDLPEQYETQMNVWMEEFIKIIDNTLSKWETSPPSNSSSEKDSVLPEYLLCIILDSLALYVNLYSGEFEPFVTAFCQRSLNISIFLNNKKHEISSSLCSSNLLFLIAVSRIKWTNETKHYSPFGNDIKPIIERVIFPNLEISNDLVDELSMDAISTDFIKSDLHDFLTEAICDSGGVYHSQLNTTSYSPIEYQNSHLSNRSVSIEFCRSLVKFHNDAVVTCVKECYMNLLNVPGDSLLSKVNGRWHHVDSVVLCLMAICSSKSTRKFGCVELNLPVADFEKILNEFICPIIDIGLHEIHHRSKEESKLIFIFFSLISCLKFVTNYRKFISLDILSPVIKSYLSLYHSNANSELSNYTSLLSIYSIIASDKVLNSVVFLPNNSSLKYCDVSNISISQFHPIIYDVIRILFSSRENEGDLSSNTLEYLLRFLLSVLIFLKKGQPEAITTEIVNYSVNISISVLKKIDLSLPTINFFAFEILSTVLSASNHDLVVEKEIVNVCNVIEGMNIIDFIPYILQIRSALFFSKQRINNTHQSVNLEWTQIISTYINNFANYSTYSNVVLSLLWTIESSLICSKGSVLDSGLQSILVNFFNNNLQLFIGTRRYESSILSLLGTLYILSDKLPEDFTILVFKLLLTRLTSRGDKIGLEVSVFFCKYICHSSFASFINITEKIQVNLWKNLITNVLLKYCGKSINYNDIIWSISMIRNSIINELQSLQNVDPQLEIEKSARACFESILLKKDTSVTLKINNNEMSGSDVNSIDDRLYSSTVKKNLALSNEYDGFMNEIIFKHVASLKNDHGLSTFVNSHLCSGSRRQLDMIFQRV